MGVDNKTTVTGVEMFRKLLDEGRAGDNAGLLLRGVDRRSWAWDGLGGSRIDYSSYKF